MSSKVIRSENPNPYYVSIYKNLILFQDTKSEELIEVGTFYISIDLGFGAFIFVSIFLQYYLLKVACANITATLRREFITAVLKQDAAWLSEQKFGAISAQLNE